MVLNNTRRNVGPCADLLVNMGRRQSTSATQQRQESVWQSPKDGNIIFVESFAVLATRIVGISTWAVEAKIDVDAVLAPEEVYLTVVCKGQVRQRNQRHRQGVDKGTGICKRFVARPLRSRPSFRFRSVFKHFQTPEQRPTCFRQDGSCLHRSKRIK